MSTSTPTIPVYFLSGLSAADKTTFLKTLLRDPAWADTLLVRLEADSFAQADDLDHTLVVHSVADSKPKPGGLGGFRSYCSCCPTPRDLAQTLKESTWRFSRNGQRLYQRVLIEVPSQLEGHADAASLHAALQTESSQRLGYYLAENWALPHP